MVNGVRRTLARALAAGLSLGALAGCGAGREDERAGRVVEDFYSAVSAKDGARACAQLSESAVAELEKDEMSPCPTAVTELELSGSTVERSTVYVTSALVELRAGDRVFLDRTPEGWKVSAAGCKPESGEEQPDDCELES